MSYLHGFMKAAEDLQLTPEVAAALEEQVSDGAPAEAAGREPSMLLRALGSGVGAMAGEAGALALSPRFAPSAGSLAALHALAPGLGAGLGNYAAGGSEGEAALVGLGAGAGSLGAKMLLLHHMNQGRMGPGLPGPRRGHVKKTAEELELSPEVVAALEKQMASQASSESPSLAGRMLGTGMGAAVGDIGGMGLAALLAAKGVRGGAADKLPASMAAAIGLGPVVGAGLGNYLAGGSGAEALASGLSAGAGSLAGKAYGTGEALRVGGGVGRNLARSAMGRRKIPVEPMSPYAFPAAVGGGAALGGMTGAGLAALGSDE